MITVMIVDDHQLVRNALNYRLSDCSGIKVVGEAKDGEEAVRLARELLPAVILMDINMPGVSGLEATTRILQFAPDTKILIVTATSNDLFSTKLLEAGAAGYITKETDFDEMLQAIRSIHLGQRYIGSKIARNLALKQISGGHSSPFDELSQRELQIVLMIIQGLKVKEIANKLHISSKTVNSYRYRIFEKLGIDGDVNLTHMALRYGICEFD